MSVETGLEYYRNVLVKACKDKGDSNSDVTDNTSLIDLVKEFNPNVNIDTTCNSISDQLTIIYECKKALVDVLYTNGIVDSDTTNKSLQEIIGKLYLLKVTPDKNKPELIRVVENLNVESDDAMYEYDGYRYTICTVSKHIHDLSGAIFYTVTIRGWEVTNIQTNNTAAILQSINGLPVISVDKCFMTNSMTYYVGTEEKSVDPKPGACRCNTTAPAIPKTILNAHLCFFFNTQIINMDNALGCLQNGLINTQNMFNSCTGWKSDNMIQITIHSINNAHGVLYNCSGIQKLQIKLGYSVPSATNLLARCTSLQSLELHIDNPKFVSWTNIFGGTGSDLIPLDCDIKVYGNSGNKEVLRGMVYHYKFNKKFTNCRLFIDGEEVEVK